MYIRPTLQPGEKSSFHADPYDAVCAQTEAHCIDPTDAVQAYARSHADDGSLFSCHFKPEIHEVIAGVIRDALILTGSPNE